MYYLPELIAYAKEGKFSVLGICIYKGQMDIVQNFPSLSLIIACFFFFNVEITSFLKITLQ